MGLRQYNAFIYRNLSGGEVGRGYSLRKTGSHTNVLKDRDNSVCYGVLLQLSLPTGSEGTSPHAPSTTINVCAQEASNMNKITRNSQIYTINYSYDLL